MSELTGIIYEAALIGNIKENRLIGILPNSTRVLLPETVAYFALMADPPARPVKLVVDDFVKAAKAAGIWDKLDFFTIAGLNNRADALFNLVGDKWHFTEHGNYVFTPYDGFVGDGVANYFTNGYNPSVGTGYKLKNDNGFYATWNLSTASGVYADWGYSPDAGNLGHYILPNYITYGHFVRWGNNIYKGSYATGEGDGFIVTNVKDGYIKCWRNGVQKISDVWTVTFLDDWEWFMDAANRQNAPLGSSPMGKRFAMAGEGLTDAEATTLYNLVLTLSNALIIFQ